MWQTALPSFLLARLGYDSHLHKCTVLDKFHSWYSNTQVSSLQESMSVHTAIWPPYSTAHMQYEYVHMGFSSSIHSSLQSQAVFHKHTGPASLQSSHTQKIDAHSAPSFKWSNSFFMLYPFSPTHTTHLSYTGIAYSFLLRKSYLIPIDNLGSEVSDNMEEYSLELSFTWPSL